jgi:CRISPR/Cas system type I-B associated protein Csh2 (Cas7 group RAMP superfamily)
MTSFNIQRDPFNDVQSRVNSDEINAMSDVRINCKITELLDEGSRIKIFNA